MAKLKFYSLDAILEKNAHYNIIIGERSNGKTTAVLRYAVERYIKTGKQTAYIRRWDDDLKGGRGAAIFNGIVSLGFVSELSGGCGDTVVYKGRAWYLACSDGEGNTLTDEKPFAYAFALTKAESYKSVAYPEIDTIVFEEFLSRSGYIGSGSEEFVILMNLLSTIIRERENVKIFMLGNTVNKYSPYFAEMGLTNIKNMQKGTIDVYSYGNSNLRVAVEFADFPSKYKPSDVYFAFDNPRLNMITGRGNVWEIDIYPHLPMRYAPKNVQLRYFIIWDGDILQCEIILLDKAFFTYIHKKTTPIQDELHDIVFTPDNKPFPNWRRNILRPADRLGEKIARFYKLDQVYYQDNETGEIVRNYLKWCKAI